MKYSASENGFYDSDIHEAIPPDAIDLTDAEYLNAMTQQSNGMVIYAGPDGKPAFKDQALPKEEEDRLNKNAKAKKYLADTDWYVVRQMDDGTPIPEDVKAARAEARASIVE